VCQLALEGLDGKYVDIGVSGGALIFLLAFVVCLVAYYFLRKRVERKWILGILALFVIGYAIRLFILLRDPLIYGIDGPWYISQVGHILQDGAMTESTAPLVMYFTAGLSAFCGDVTLGVKISQAFLSALPILTIWLLVRYLTKNNFASFVAALVLGLSAMTVGMSDVLRNTGALAFLPLFYLFFLKFVNGEGRKWTIKAPLKIRGKNFGLTFSTNFVLSLVIFLVILGCHFLTAGFAVMTVVAYMAFFTGYRRKIPWRELKFLAVLGLIMLVGIAAFGTLRNKILNTANTISTSEPVPAGLFPFSETSIPTPPGGADESSPEKMFTFFLPFIILALPAVWFTLRHRDRRYLLFTATILLSLLCSQIWVVNSNYAFRFVIMMYIALFVLMGISIWYVRKHLKKVAAVILICVIGFSAFTLVSMGATAGAWITEEDWTELRSIGQQLPENSVVMAPGMEGLFRWGQLVFEKEIGSTFQPWGPSDIEQLAQGMQSTEQTTGMTCLAVVEKDLVADVENLENLGLQIYDNVQTAHYIVLQRAENSGGTKQRSATQEKGPGGLLVYENATLLDLSQAELQELIFGEHAPPPEVSIAAYTTSASLIVVGSWYENEMPKQGWVAQENMTGEHSAFLRYSKAGGGAIIKISENASGTVLALAEWSEGGEGPGDGGPDMDQLEASSEIRFNYNPLFAFILLPIELTQGLYGTAIYGILKLTIAIPLSVGLIGLLIGFGPALVRKFKKSEKPQPRRE